MKLNVQKYIIVGALAVMLVTPTAVAHAGFYDRFQSVLHNLIVQLEELVLLLRDREVVSPDPIQEPPTVPPNQIPEPPVVLPEPPVIPPEVVPEPPTVSPDPVSGNAPEIMSANVVGNTVTLTIAASRTEEITPCGPIFFARVYWDDGSTAGEATGLGCSSERQTFTLEHTYQHFGSYTITVTDLYGNSTEQDITIGGNIAYTIADVAEVREAYFDPVANMADDEYTLYTIHLRNGTTRAVAIYSMSIWEMNEQNFFDTGYTGNVQELIDMAN